MFLDLIATAVLLFIWMFLIVSLASGYVPLLILTKTLPLLPLLPGSLARLLISFGRFCIRLPWRTVHFVVNNTGNLASLVVVVLPLVIFFALAGEEYDETVEREEAVPGYSTELWEGRYLMEDVMEEVKEDVNRDEEGGDVEDRDEEDSEEEEMDLFPGWDSSMTLG